MRDQRAGSQHSAHHDHESPAIGPRKGGHRAGRWPDGRDCHCAEHGPRIHGFLIPCILAHLVAEPAHGYRLMEVLSNRHYIPQLPDPGVLYRHLRKLEQNGLVTSSLEPGAGPARRVYAITDEGTACLSDWVRGLERLQTELSDFIADTNLR